MSFYKNIPLLFLLTFLLANTSTSAQNLFGQKASFEEEKGIELICEVTSCGPADEFAMWKFNGVLFEKAFDATLVGQDSFRVLVPEDTKGVFYVGTDKNQKMPVIFGEEKKIFLKGNCLRLRQADISTSPINKEYNEMMNSVKSFQGQYKTLMRNYMMQASTPEKKAEIEKSLKEVDDNQIALYEELKTKSPYVAKIFAGFLQVSYANNKGAYKNDLEHFVGDFFKYVDLKDEDYNNAPPMYEVFRNFSTTISSIPKLPAKTHKEILDNVLNQIPEDSQAYKYALGAFISATKGKNHPNFAGYAQLYLDKYATIHPKEAANIEAQLVSAKSFIIGGEAPDFTSNDPDGKEISLKDFRGKVVLIDFWASWCGPCRKENPNVVRMYDKYKDKGFEILGVSLDKTKPAWLKAIAKDGLTWPQVSDLKGWKNDTAALYSITSIPRTVLVDKEGKILARNLRGPELEAELAKIFGE